MAREYKKVLYEHHDIMSQVCIKLVCDKCKKESDISEQHAFRKLTDQGMGIGILQGYDSMSGKDRTDLDLCFECLEEITDQIMEGL